MLQPKVLSSFKSIISILVNIQVIYSARAIKIRFVALIGSKMIWASLQQRKTVMLTFTILCYKKKRSLAILIETSCNAQITILSLDLPTLLIFLAQTTKLWSLVATK